MLKEFKQHLNNHFSFLEGKKILIAISGGIDSVVLTHLMHQLDFDFSLAHCNFSLRGAESNEDEKFVKELAERFTRNIYTVSFDTEKYAKEQKQSIQIAARELRYEWFYNTLKENNIDYVLTAHNNNDNLETFLINLTRGTGLDGFTGIPPINGKIVRPLLAFSRDQIMMFAIKNNIAWREDKSNASIKYIRNKVRHKIVPILQEINPHLLDTFKNTLTYLNESKDIVDTEIAEVSKSIIEREANGILKFSIQKLKSLTNVKAYLFHMLKEYGFTEWNDILHLLDAQSGKQVFSNEYRLIKDRDFLMLAPINKDILQDTSFYIDEGIESIKNPIPIRIEASEENSVGSQSSILVDKDLLNFPLRVRKWGYGDYICPTGMLGTKKLSQLFKDRKLSLIEKENVWLLTDAHDHIIWVIGLRQDRRFSVSKNSENILKISSLL
ncbi:MAG: tRNA lysidine(34) synthetase TilS [Flavobacteriaceae bacterium]